MPESTQNDSPLMQLDGITKVFVAEEMETYALSGVHLDIHEGDFVAISGPSGCGKSTLLSILGLLDLPTAGTYLLGGENMNDASGQRRARLRNRDIGFIFQSFNLIGDLSVFENVELPLVYRGLPAPARRDAVETALEKVQMSHRQQHLPGQLSGGQQQRVAVARALAGSPRILLADEPTGNLDSRNGETVMELLRQLHESGTTLCIVTHDERYARAANRIVHLLDGRVVNEELPHRAGAVGAA